MYHCHVHFYLIGCLHHISGIIKEMSPMEHFSHEFTESERPEKDLLAKADVVFMDLQGLDIKETVQMLVLGKKKEAEIILLTSREETGLLPEDLSDIKDIWTIPMSDGEIRFRFLRWQQTYKMEKDFWQTSHFFESTINYIPNLIWYKNTDGIHEKVNDSFCRTVNKTKEQVEGRGHAYIWDVEHDDPACIESEREVMSSRKTCVSEETIQTGEGQRILTTYKSPLYDLDGSVMGTVGVAIDVTQERDYEREITKNNELLEKIFTNIDCGVIYHKVDGQIIRINRAALEILGFRSKEDLVANGFDMVASSVMDEDKITLRSRIQSLKKEGDNIGVEYRVKHQNGEIRHVTGNVKLLKEDGELIYQRFLLDSTVQKLEEKKKERLQNELVQALTIDYNLVCFFDLDTGEGYPLRNDDGSGHAFESVFSGNLSLRESLEFYIQKYVYEEDKEMLRQALSEEWAREELAEKKFYCTNYRMMQEDKIVYFQAKVVRAGIWGEHHTIVLGFHSVDEETRGEMEKKRMLEDALMQANQASKAKSVFLSNMSHDIRTPMNAIVGFTTLAIAHIDNKEQVQEYLDKINTSGNHLLSLINDVLDMSRIESGRIRLEEKPCSLPDILHGIRNILQADIRAKQLELYIDTVDIFDEEIYCDKLRLNQVLLNLLGNSVKYTGAGGSVSLRIVEKAGAPAGFADYEFYIKDTGIGMSKEFVAHIFEPFEREENTEITQIQGTGLGMAITKNIVDMMGGSIVVRSEQGAGTEFLVSFRFRLHLEAKEPQVIMELNNRRALVVDDDFNTCDSVSYMLGQVGMRAEWTLSGKEALLRTQQAITRDDSYCAYVIDWLLPDMNGIEVTRRIRKAMGDEVPIIILTAYDWSDIEEEAKQAGVSAFCSKPLFLSELRSSLYSVLHKEEERESEDTSLAQRTGRILLAEDVELNQEIAIAILGDAGFDVEIAENGQIAVDMIKKSDPGYYQVVLMDIRMPVMNGYEATKVIRSLEDPHLASIPILAMSANAFEEDKREALKCGMNGHIAKPIDVNRLFEALDEVLVKN
mgnify:CR=1 FL=1